MMVGHTKYWRGEMGPDYMRYCISVQDTRL